MGIADLLNGFDQIGRADSDESTSHLKKKGSKRGRWKPPPESAKWSDLYSTCSGGIMTALQVCQEVVGVVERGDRLHAMTSGWWSMEQPICVIGEQLGPVDMWMISWAVNDDAVLRLVEAMDRGFIRNVRAVIDERMKVLRPAALDIMQVAVGEGNLGIMACHAKAYVLKQVEGDLAVAMVTSANWTQNPRPESVCIDADPRAAQVYATWVDRMLDTGRARPYQHTGKMKDELMSEHVIYDFQKVSAPGVPIRPFPSFSEIDAWKACPRQWWLIYRAGVETEISSYGKHVLKVHEEAESYLKGKESASDLVSPVVHLLPKPRSGQVETDVLAYDVPLMARLDWLGDGPDGVLTILDHKTTKKKKREKALRRDTQAMICAWVAMTSKKADRCRLRWVWYDDRTVTEIEVTLEQAAEATKTDREIAEALWNAPPDNAQDVQRKKNCFTCEVNGVCPCLVTVDDGKGRLEEPDHVKDR